MIKIEDYDDPITVAHMTRSEALETWARSQKRVTNRMIRINFRVDEEKAGETYDYLRQIGIVGSMGYVEKEEVRE